MTEPTLAELRGNTLADGEQIGSTFSALSRRIPELPSIPGGRATPAIEAALDAAQTAIDAADDILTEQSAWDVLHEDPETLAAAAFKAQLVAGDAKASYDADRFRAERVRVEVAFNKAVSVARTAVAKAQKAISAESGDLIDPANARFLAAAQDWRDAHAAAQAARHTFARAADDRAQLLLATGEHNRVNGGEYAVQNAESILINVPASHHVTNASVNAAPSEIITAVLERLKGLGAVGLGKLNKIY